MVVVTQHIHRCCAFHFGICFIPTASFSHILHDSFPVPFVASDSAKFWMCGPVMNATINKYFFRGLAKIVYIFLVRCAGVDENTNDDG